jgi:putative CocE/NonD family hydrolase
MLRRTFIRSLKRAAALTLAWPLLLKSRTALGRGIPLPPRRATEPYSFTTRNLNFSMADGVRLAATLYIPKAQTKNERFPALLEMLPYRKDDLFALRDYERASHFAKRGYVVARVDVRGTGGSEGALPNREYSQQELTDATTIIDQLSKQPWSNGKVGMYGISWSGFNALMVAKKRPPALKAVLAVHASDNQYLNDIHYIDGVLHMDTYSHQISSDNALPQSPHYTLNESYFRDRFDQKPWIFTWFHHQQNDAFWRDESLGFQQPLPLPAYLIGGLLDGYRDFILSVGQDANAPIIAEIGPWNHAWPDDGEPGPNHDWQQRAVRWWDYWLKGIDTGILKEPHFMVFVRAGHEPSTNEKETPGHWRCYPSWPPKNQQHQRLYLSSRHRLQEKMEAQTLPSQAHQLAYQPGSGMTAGVWWGEQTGDMAADDAQSLIYDSPPLSTPLTIIGQPEISLRIAADAGYYHWSVRLEDVSPTGKVSLVSGVLIHPSQRLSGLTPQPLPPGQAATLKAKIHVTTWTFKPGHRIRLAISNAQFPMAWPTPHRGNTTLILGANTWLTLPLAPADNQQPCKLPPPAMGDAHPQGRILTPENNQITIHHDPDTGEAAYAITNASAWSLGPKNFEEQESYRWSVNETNPATAEFKGDRQVTISLQTRKLELKSSTLIRSDANNFYLTFTRYLLENGQGVRTRTWSEAIPRNQQ